MHRCSRVCAVLCWPHLVAPVAPKPHSFTATEKEKRFSSAREKPVRVVGPIMDVNLITFSTELRCSNNAFIFPCRPAPSSSKCIAKKRGNMIDKKKPNRSAADYAQQEQQQQQNKHDYISRLLALCICILYGSIV